MLATLFIVLYVWVKPTSTRWTLPATYWWNTRHTSTRVTVIDIHTPGLREGGGKVQGNHPTRKSSIAGSEEPFSGGWERDQAGRSGGALSCHIHSRPPVLLLAVADVLRPHLRVLLAGVLHQVVHHAVLVHAWAGSKVWRNSTATSQN